MKSIEECIKKLCTFPVNYLGSNLSPQELIEESGYGYLKDQVTEKLIMEYFEDHPKLITQWIGYSENIRHLPAWGIKHYGEKWMTFYVDSDRRIEYIFSSVNEACAKMVYETVESIG